MANALDPRKEPTLEQLWEFHLGKVRDPDERARLAGLAESDPRCRAHLHSLRHLRAEEDAAVQDGADLAAFSPAAATELCRRAAQSNGRVFEPLFEAPAGVGREERRQWDAHADRCVYCRRMKRLACARVQARRAGLPDGELLLRDWLLGRHYAARLEWLTGALLPATEPPEGVGSPELEAVSRAIQALPLDLRLVVLLRRRDKKSHEEIAAFTETPVEEVRRLEEKAYEQVRQAAEQALRARRG